MVPRATSRKANPLANKDSHGDARQVRFLCRTTVDDHESIRSAGCRRDARAIVADLSAPTEAVDRWSESDGRRGGEGARVSGSDHALRTHHTDVLARFEDEHGGRVRRIAAITDPLVARWILRYIGARYEPLPLAQARPPRGVLSFA